MYLLYHSEAAPLEITQMFDADYEPVEEWEDAFCFVAGPMADGQWLAGLCEEFVVRKAH